MAMRVAIFEDDSATRMMLTTYLRSHGMGVAAHESAVDVVRHTRGCMPDVILMDMWMPSVDGMEAIRQLRADPSTRNIPILLWSADILRPIEQSASLWGADAFVSKPISPSKIAEVLRTLCQVQ